MWQTVILSLVAGGCAANGTPHFVKGVLREPFPSALGNGPVANFLGGWAMYLGAAVAIIYAKPGDHSASAVIAAALGALILGGFHARIGAFGRHGAHAPLTSAPPPAPAPAPAEPDQQN